MVRLPNGTFWVETEEPLPDTKLTPDHGVLAIGGSMSGPYLIEAYKKGIFPWNDPQDSTLWWYPPERMVITKDSLHVSKSMRKVLRDKLFTITINKAFDQVLQGCARKGEDTWLHDALMKGLVEAHVAGVAMSVEAWQGEKLVGGLFGMHLGHFFSGDSMFSWVPNASKAAFITFAMQAFSEGLSFIDCQVPSAHLQSLGGKTINRKYFEKLLSHGN